MQATTAIHLGNGAEAICTEKPRAIGSFRSYVLLHGRMVVVGYAPRGDERHIFSMRKANEREQRKISSLIGI
jgi:uncharacterized DUF497 family protein